MHGSTKNHVVFSGEGIPVLFWRFTLADSDRHVPCSALCHHVEASFVSVTSGIAERWDFTLFCEDFRAFGNMCYTHKNGVFDRNGDVLMYVVGERCMLGEVAAEAAVDGIQVRMPE